MKDKPDVMYVPEIAQVFGRTETAVRQAVNRGVDWLPAPFYMGRRIAWRRLDVEAWLKQQSRKTER